MEKRRFFVPFARDSEVAEKTYSEIKANVQRNHPRWKILPERIFAVDHTHNGERLRSEVGQRDPWNAETVIAIFQTAGGV
jgi:hypothetical protein